MGTKTEGKTQSETERHHTSPKICVRFFVHPELGHRQPPRDADDSSINSWPWPCEHPASQASSTITLSSGSRLRCAATCCLHGDMMCCVVFRHVHGRHHRRHTTEVPVSEKRIVTHLHVFPRDSVQIERSALYPSHVREAFHSTSMLFSSWIRVSSNTWLEFLRQRSSTCAPFLHLVL